MHAPLDQDLAGAVVEDVDLGGDLGVWEHVVDRRVILGQGGVDASSGLRDCDAVPGGIGSVGACAGGQGGLWVRVCQRWGCVVSGF